MAERDRIAIVTGTSSGIGAALAEALLKDSWQVVGLSRRTVGFADPRYQHLAIDLGDLSNLSQALDEGLGPILKDGRWQRVGLVNNAGTIGTPQPLEDTELDSLAQVFAVNAIAPIFLMSYVVREVLPPSWLRIVNISTGAAKRAALGLSAYSSSKAALLHAGRILAAELSSADHPAGPRPRVAILSYEPSVVATAMQIEARSASREQFPWKQPFLDYAARGMLQSPEVVVGEVLDFLNGDSQEPFTERRFDPGQ
jgi:benzil reductase ((S)-benzoin forming)